MFSSNAIAQEIEEYVLYLNTSERAFVTSRCSNDGPFRQKKRVPETDPQEQMLLAKIEGLKNEVRKQLALLMDDPETPEFFKKDPTIQEVTKRSRINLRNPMLRA